MRKRWTTGGADPDWQTADEGKMVIRVMLRVLLGKRMRSGDQWVYPTLAQRMEAATWLVEHGVGRSAPVSAMSGSKRSGEFPREEVDGLKAYLKQTRQLVEAKSAGRSSE